MHVTLEENEMAQNINIFLKKKFKKEKTSFLENVDLVPHF